MTDTRIAIVGGGLAGLAAAQRLTEAGFTNLILLEADSRLGGRIHTLYDEGNVTPPQTE